MESMSSINSFKGTSDEDVASIPIGQQKGNKTHIGYGVWMARVACDQALKERDSSKFVNTVAQRIWSDEELAISTTRATKGVDDRVVFCSIKKGAVLNVYSIWLEKKFFPDIQKISNLRLGTLLYLSKLFIFPNRGKVLVTLVPAPYFSQLSSVFRLLLY